MRHPYSLRRKQGETIRVQTGIQENPIIQFKYNKDYVNGRGEMWTPATPKDRRLFKKIVDKGMLNNINENKAHISVFHNDPSNAHISYKTTLGDEKLRAGSQQILRKFAKSLKRDIENKTKSEIEKAKKKRTSTRILRQMGKLRRPIVERKYKKLEHIRKILREKKRRMAMKFLTNLQDQHAWLVKHKRLLKFGNQSKLEQNEMNKMIKYTQKYISSLNKIAE